MFISVFLIALLTPVNAFASQTDDNMEVIARIEAPSDEISSPSNIDAETSSPQTGSDRNSALWIVLLCISGISLGVTVVYGKRENILRK